MIKQIEKPYARHYTRCIHCGAAFTYDLTDVQHNVHITAYVECPACKMPQTHHASQAPAEYDEEPYESYDQTPA